MDAQFVAELRQQFPSLQKEIDGTPIVYFDGPAGTQVPLRVADAVRDSMLDKNANKCGLFQTSIESDRLVAEAHQALADFVGANDPAEIIFGQSMTTLTYSLSRSMAKTWSTGDEIVLTQLDHDANITPWQQAAEEAGVVVRYVSIDPETYELDMKVLRESINQRTKLVAVCCASNVTGGLVNVQEIVAATNAVGAISFLDAVHLGPHDLVDVQAYGCDFLTCSTYKFFGPHLGVLWGRRELLESLPAFQLRPAPTTIPGKWMTGTQSHELIVGALECVNYIAGIGAAVDNKTTTRREQLIAAFRAIREYESKLSQVMLEGLNLLDGVRVYGVTDQDQLTKRVPTFSFTHDRVSTKQIVKQLADRQIQVWGGNYYSLQFSEEMGLEPDGMVRIGLMHYNTVDEVKVFLQAMSEILQETISTI